MSLQNADVAQQRAPRVFMMDLWATVPYYTAYLSKALRQIGVEVQVGSMTYYLDRSCYTGRGLRTSPGLMDVVGRLHLPKVARRVLKFGEGWLNLLALRTRFRRRAPDVLHVQYLPLLRSRLPFDRRFVRWCQRRGIPAVLTVHDLLPHDTGNAHRTLYRELYSGMDALICHSGHVRSRLVDEFAIAPDKISVIPHGPFFFDIRVENAAEALRELGVPPGKRMVLWQGIILPYKGVDLLLNAWQKIEQQTTDLCLVVLGTGDPGLIASLEGQARQLGLQNVRFLPRFCSSEELVAAYRAAEMVVYPYRAITTSGALATGLSLGRAIVASRLPVFEELLRDRENGLLADPNDAADLAEAILTLDRDPELRSRLEQEVKAMNFSEKVWQAIAADTAGVYERVCADRGRAGALASMAFR